MNADEQTLIACAKAHIQEKTTSLKGSETRVETARYRDPQVFSAEVNRIFNRVPTLLIHSSELSEPNTVIDVQSTLGSLILSRDAEGKTHVFHNACRHRGAKLVSGKACSKRIVCPYHAWSYTTDGALRNVPGKQHCFPDLLLEDNGLIEIPSVERHGFIWMCPGAHKEDDLGQTLAKFLGDMSKPFEALETENFRLYKRERKLWNANWKLFAEGGLETYHFAFAHKNTIAPYFHNNTAVIDQFSQHIRVFMPMKSLTSEESAEQRALRPHDCSHTLYFFTPNTGLLVQKEHIDLIQFRPVSVDQTEISISSLIPNSADLENAIEQEHWQKNFDITDRTLSEDWELSVSIQQSIQSNALPYVQYGRNEWALKAFNAVLDSFMTDE